MMCMTQNETPPRTRFRRNATTRAACRKMAIAYRGRRTRESATCPSGTGANRRVAAEAVLTGGFIGLGDGRSLLHGRHALRAAHQRRRLAGLDLATRGDCERER